MRGFLKSVTDAVGSEEGRAKLLARARDGVTSAAEITGEALTSAREMATDPELRKRAGATLLAVQDRAKSLIEGGDRFDDDDVEEVAQAILVNGFGIPDPQTGELRLPADEEEARAAARVLLASLEVEDEAEVSA